MSVSAGAWDPKAGVPQANAIPLTCSICPTLPPHEKQNLQGTGNAFPFFFNDFVAFSSSCEMEETDRNAQSCFSQDVETEEARLPQLKAAARRGRKRGE